MSESKQTGRSAEDRTGSKRFADLMHGFFFLVSSISVLIVMVMLVFVWQQIWEEGFKDFHTISTAIDNLNETARPAAESVPMMLGEMQQMNKNLMNMQITVQDMEVTLQSMQGSMYRLEKMTPELIAMTDSVEHMDYSVTEQMQEMTRVMKRMSYLLDEMEDQLSPAGMMPFNW